MDLIDRLNLAPPTFLTVFNKSRLQLASGTMLCCCDAIKKQLTKSEFKMAENKSKAFLHF